MTGAWIIRGAVAIVTVTLAVAYWFRGDIFQTFQDPGQPFQTSDRHTRPDYAKPSAWMALPDLARDSATLETSGDVFVVVPEVYKGSEHWNLPIEDDRRRDKLLRIVRPNYVDPYRDAGRLFAPYYRQAALYAFLNNRKDSQQAQDFAYADVLRAFDSFTANSPPERPIVLVGHGQGAAHAQRLLQDRFQGPLKQKLAVAYIIDHPLPLANLGGIPACAEATDSQCVVAFTTIMPGETARAARLRDRTLVHMGNGFQPVAGKPLLCTNPLTWQTHTAVAAKDLHKGGVGAVGFEPDMRPTIHPQQVSAQCQNGLLTVSKPDVPSLRRPRKIGGRYRTLPSNLFYEDLRLNAQARVDALIAKDILPKRAPVLAPLDVETIETAPIIIEE